MAISQQHSSPSWGSFILALLGAAYCAVLASPLQESLPCPSSGCYLFRDVAVAGISFWWIGTAAFIALALLCLSRYHAPALIFAGLCLAADCVLLVVMFFTAPCLTCLGAAFFFAVIYLCLRRPAAARYQVAASPRPSILFLLWGALFIANLGAAATEQLGDWVLTGPADADRRVYFSPSCPACREAITVFAGQAAFIPVAENDDDYQAIINMQAAVQDGKSITEALAAAYADPVAVTPDAYLLLRLRLLRNKGTVLGLGFNKLPLLMINGMPQGYGTAGAASISGSSASGASDSRPGVGSGASDVSHGLPPELNLFNLGQCGDDIAPCDPTPPGI
ncbi:hypothetical protein LJC23_05165 [Desulfovibrio sp. OttesenSCG-928-I05]|nr:hypothetical protein [Desulfovibrio sp. OttesenSCG-928-I05]